MSLIQEKDRIEIKNQLATMKNPVKIINFTQKYECHFCSETRQLMEDLTSLSDKLSLEVYDFMENKDQAEKYKIDRIPATILMGDKDTGIRFYGIPSGYEFVTLLDGIGMVSNRDSGLSEDSRKKLAGIKEPIHLQVFVTPTCPYCPRAVHLAHQFAMESDHIVADMVEATEFPELSQRYGVMGVPRTIANDQTAAEGALPEAHFLDHILMATKQREAA